MRKKKFLREVSFSPLSTKIKVMLVLMHLYKGFDVYYILIYSHNKTHTADTSAGAFTNESIALIVQVRLKRSGPRAAHHLS